MPWLQMLGSLDLQGMGVRGKNTTRIMYIFQQYTKSIYIYLLIAWP